MAEASSEHGRMTHFLRSIPPKAVMEYAFRACLRVFPVVRGRRHRKCIISYRRTICARARACARVVHISCFCSIPSSIILVYVEKCFSAPRFRPRSARHSSLLSLLFSQLSRRNMFRFLASVPALFLYLSLSHSLLLSLRFTDIAVINSFHMLC